MTVTLMNILHIAPLMIILGLTIISKVLVKIDTLPSVLILSSIGIASGFGVHHDAVREIPGMCYLCFGYAAVLAFAGFKLSKTKLVIQKRT